MVSNSIIVTFYNACVLAIVCFFFFQAEDGIRDLVRSRGLGDVYKRQEESLGNLTGRRLDLKDVYTRGHFFPLRVAQIPIAVSYTHLTLPTSDLV